MSPPKPAGGDALHNAVLEGRADDARAALAAGADAIAADTAGFTPLHLAALAGSPEMVAFLVRSGADVGARNRFGNTPLCFRRRSPKPRRAPTTPAAAVS